MTDRSRSEVGHLDHVLLGKQPAPCLKYLHSCHIKDGINFLCVSSEGRVRTQAGEGRFWLDPDEDFLPIGASDNLITWRSNSFFVMARVQRLDYHLSRLLLRGSTLDERSVEKISKFLSKLQTMCLCVLSK